MNDSPACSFEVDADSIGWLTLDKPGGSANTLGRAVLLDLQAQVEIAESRALRGLVIRSGKPSGFIAGADIREFTSLGSEGEALELITLGQRICSRIEALPYPTVAAIHGFALGGGLELALACDYRIGVGDSKLALGLPEVQLGIHPGFGGTVRSVRLLGVRPAMDLMLSGRTVRADQALDARSDRSPGRQRGRPRGGRATDHPARPAAASTAMARALPELARRAHAAAPGAAAPGRARGPS